MKRTNHLFVIDTNTLVSAFIKPGSTARRALDKANAHGYVIVSRLTVDEFSYVFARPKFDKYLPLDIRLDILNNFISLATHFEPQITITDCRDQKDNQFLELAVAANASCIVSGDQDLLVLNPFRNIPILTPADFLNTTF